MNKPSIVAYKATNTASKFHQSEAFVRGLRGPIGSGKSVACCFEIFRRALEQQPNQDNIRKSRWLVVRNTLPQLETTTMKTWADWFPPGEVFGRMTGKPPYTHYVKYGPLEDGTTVDLEVQFIALDKPEDVKKLLSYECTGIWFNEARELEKSIIDAGTGRVGRYPSKKDGGATWSGIIMDTNPPSDDHWWYHHAEEETPEGWEFFTQPSGLSKEAENIDNLPENYYKKMSHGKTKEWIDVYVHGKYGFIKEGQPVFGSAFNPDLHVAKQNLKHMPGEDIYIGIDSSGRHPATVFLRKTARGQWQALDELCILEDEGMGAVQYAKLIKAQLDKHYPDNDYVIYGDPAGGWKSQNDERTYFDIMKSQGIRIKPSPGLRLPDRLETVFNVLGRMVDGEPAILISPKCKTLIRGFNGGYQYKRIMSTGEARYDEKPFKNRFSDVQDALQYILCGAGEMRRMMGKNKTGARKAVAANANWSVF